LLRVLPDNVPEAVPLAPKLSPTLSSLDGKNVSTPFLTTAPAPLVALIVVKLEIEIGPTGIRKLPPELKLVTPVRKLLVIDRKPPVTGTAVVEADGVGSGVIPDKLFTRAVGKVTLPPVSPVIIV